MIRTIARPMLASVFIIDGVSVLRNPNARASATAPAVSRIAKTAGSPTAPAAQATAAADGSATQPAPDAMSKNVVMGLAAAKVGAGALFAIGKLPRISATVLAAAHAPTMVARFSNNPGGSIASTDTKLVGLATDAALLGALFMAAADTQGKPGLAWRYKHAKGEVAAALPTIKGEARELKDVLESAAHSMGKDARTVAGAVEEKSHSASQAMASGIESGLPKLQEGAKHLQDQAVHAASVASAQLSDAVQKANDNLPDSKKVAKRSKKARKNARRKLNVAEKKAAQQRKDFEKNLPSKGEVSAAAAGAIGTARLAATDLYGRTQQAVQDSNFSERAHNLADEASAKSAPLMSKLRTAFSDRTATATALSEEARARALAAKAAAAGDIKTAKKQAKAAEKAASKA